MKEKTLEKIYENFELTEKEKSILLASFEEDINFERLDYVLDFMLQYKMEKDMLIPYSLFQASKFNSEKTETLAKNLSENELSLYETFKILRDVSSLKKGGESEAEDIRRMFVAICQDMRVVIVKFATILFDLKKIELPMSDDDLAYAKMVSEIFAPLAERLGLSMFKNEFEDKCFELLEPNAYQELKNNALMKADDNERQIEITRARLMSILYELGIKGEIQARQKHFYSVYKKLIKKNITLGKVYDLVAMRVLVENIEDCYE